MKRIIDEYILKVWSDTYNRYIKYCSYTTLKRVKEQILRYIEDYNKSFGTRGSWYIWRGNKPVDFRTVKYLVVHKQYKMQKEEILEEIIENI